MEENATHLKLIALLQAVMQAMFAFCERARQPSRFVIIPSAELKKVLLDPMIGSWPADTVRIYCSNHLPDQLRMALSVYDYGGIKVELEAKLTFLLALYTTLRTCSVPAPHAPFSLTMSVFALTDAQKEKVLHRLINLIASAECPWQVDLVDVNVLSTLGNQYGLRKLTDPAAMTLSQRIPETV